MLVKRFIKKGLFLKNVSFFKPAPAVNYHAPKEEWKGAGMNDLPIPEGDWQEDYNRRNLPYNIFMASGIIAFVVSLVVGIKTEKINYNFFPPNHYDNDKATR